jgi:hypothetical protein
MRDRRARRAPPHPTPLVAEEAPEPAVRSDNTRLIIIGMSAVIVILVILIIILLSR